MKYAYEFSNGEGPLCKGEIEGTGFHSAICAALEQIGLGGDGTRLFDFQVSEKNTKIVAVYANEVKLGRITIKQVEA